MKGRFVLLLLLSCSLIVEGKEIDDQGQGPTGQSRNDPYGCLTAGKVQNLNAKGAASNCAIAEMMKRNGDYRAAEYYKKAIDAEDEEPAYELFFADYLRNFRGAQHPLFPEAEKHYFEALRKLKQLKKREPFDAETERRIERGLVALYQQDGLPLLHWESNQINSGSYLQRPFWFVSSIVQSAHSTYDFDRVDDVRSFTSEALFASSAIRLNRPLTEDELKRIVRAKQQTETLDRTRIRYKDLPVVDVLYKYRNIDDAQIGNFFLPNKFNSVSLNEYGVAVEKPFNVAPYFDLFLKGTFKKIDREGVIEFFPASSERINHFETNAVLSRFVGPDKVNLEFTYVFQDINPQIANPPRRDRTIVAGKFTYQLFRRIGFIQPVYGNRFETRGFDLFGGALQDTEAFGKVEIRKNDLFFGASLKGIGRGKVDVTVQPTLFTAEVSGDRSQKNSQFRTNAVFLYRFVDEEAHPGVSTEGQAIHLAFLHLVVPFSNDVAMTGLEAFENSKIGIGLYAKLFTTGLRRTSFLTSLRYDYQRFPNLNQSRNLLSFNFGIGF